MPITIEPTGEACGARITGVDLTNPIADDDVAAIREAWLEHHVLIFPNQPMSIDDLERFSLSFGEFGVDPFIKSVEGRDNVIAIRREADETSRIFADIWHTDWSFQPIPPAGTCLLGIDIPPHGGDTLFANQELALQRMPDELRDRLEGKLGVHSAVMGYSKNGSYGDKDEGRSGMEIEPSDEAHDKELHPLIRTHPESGKEMVFGTAIAYLIGVHGMDQKDGMDLLMDLQKWQTDDQFVYRHRWEENMLVMWDNRSVLHKATGGFEGHRRELLRTTVADNSDGAQAQHEAMRERLADLGDVAPRTTEQRDVTLSLDEVLAALTPAVTAFGGIDPAVDLTITPNPPLYLQGTTVSTERVDTACSITMASGVFQSVVDGESSLVESFLEGKIEIEGDSSVAIAIQGLF